MKPATYTLSRFTNPNGLDVSQVMFGGLPLIPETTDHVWAEQYARDTFRNAIGQAVLKHWDGDEGRETILDTKGLTFGERQALTRQPFPGSGFKS